MLSGLQRSSSPVLCFFLADRFPLLPPDLLVAAIAIENLRHLAFCAMTGCAVAQPKNTAAAAARRDQPVFCSRCDTEPTSVIEIPAGRREQEPMYD
jgi:hypothetical protein